MYVVNNNLSFTTYNQLETKLNQIINEKKINFIDDKIGEFSYSLKDLGITVQENGENIVKKSKQKFKWFTIQPQNMTFKLLNINEKNISTNINNIMKKNKIQAPQNAYIKYQDGKYIIVPEVNTNMVDSELITKALIENLKQSTYTLDTTKYYQTPTIKEQDLASSLIVLNKIINKQITLKFDEEEYKLSKKELSKFIDIQDDGSYKIKEDKFEEFVTSLSYTYDTVSYTATKRTQNQYYATDLGKELTKDLQNDTEDNFIIEVNNNPFIKKLQQKAKTKEKTYIEVNLTSQYMWYYKAGKLFMTSPVVTGDHSNGWDTPTGTFNITEKLRNKILDGSSVGFEYQYHVDYWMRITNSGVGFHDTQERSYNEYGSDTYLYGGGSHGCVNLPPTKAQKLYTNLKVGTKVYITA